MKFMKKPVVTVAFCISVCFAYSQDNTSGNISDTSNGSVIKQEDSGSGTSVLSDSNQGTDSIVPDKKDDSSGDKKGADNRREKKSETRKRNAESIEKESEDVPVKEKENDVQSAPFEGELLQINEGNFKYKRIPDIKLPENPVTMAGDQTIDAASAENTGDDNDSGFWGMSKSTADVVVKVGVILFILLIFVIYRSRMRGSGGRKSGSKVLNSYRK